jgi:hypothetical protein
MKEPDEDRMTSIDIPSKLQTEKAAEEDENPKEDVKEEAKEEKEGSLKDYFVSHRPGPFLRTQIHLSMCSAFSHTQV